MGRRLGQHFLARKSILEKIAAEACPEAPHSEAEAPVIEIGPGKGALTECLLERASAVTAIEIDPVLVHYLRQKFRDAMETGRLALIEGDVLKIDLAVLAGGRRAVVTGNLPYYITSPILQRVFSLGTSWERGVFLVQAEVAARLAAVPGTRDYGFLSVLAQVHARVEILFPVARTAFRPPPKVDSAVIRLEPREVAEVDDADGFLKFASACFRYKRKMLRNNLAPLYGRERMDAMEEGRLRAEQMSVAELAALRRKLEGMA